jgi:hypothetical protein
LDEAASPQGSVFGSWLGGAGLDRGSAAGWYPQEFRPWGRSLVLGFLLEDITMTDLKIRMIEDMQLAGHSQGTQDAYVRVVRQLAEHFRVLPDQLTERQLREYVEATSRHIARASTRLFCDRKAIPA